MNLRASFISILAVAACASAPGIDRPQPLDPGYALREAAARKPADRCGPEFISDNLPQAVVGFMEPVLDGPFREVCKRHDACYELREQTQAWCDQRMRTEMMDICAAGRDGRSFAGRLCRMRAGLYHRMVDNAFGAYAYEGKAGGHIRQVEFLDAPQGQTQICVEVENTSHLLQQYAVELWQAGGRRVDRAPEFRTRSVRAGTSSEFCVGTVSSTYWNLKRIGGDAEIRLLVDRPDSLALTGDLERLETRAIPRRDLD